MTTDARKRAHAAHMRRRKAEGWRMVTLMLTPAEAAILDRLKRSGDESNPTALRRILRELSVPI